MFELSLALSKLLLLRRLVKLLFGADQRQFAAFVFLLVLQILQDAINVISSLANP